VVRLAAPATLLRESLKGTFLPTGLPKMAVGSLTWNASSPFQAEPAQDDDGATIKSCRQLVCWYLSTLTL
jgi:hypothetical protein